MPLTEAQRLAFLKGREKRMANIEKAKLEKAEMEALGKDIMKELESMHAPEKPKVVRKPRKTKAVVIEDPVQETKPVDVKLEIDLGTSIQREDTVPDVKTSGEPEPALPHAVSESKIPTATFDEDAIATKVVSMLLQKGIGVPLPSDSAKQVKPKKTRPPPPPASKSPKKTKPPPPPKSTTNEFPTPSASFSWM